MLSENSPNAEKTGTLDLGYILCKWCGNIIGTLPTNGVKRIYGQCPDRACVKEKQTGEVS
jgi:hypothetical protein